MTISTEFAAEGELEIWAFSAHGRERIDHRLEPDTAVSLLAHLTVAEAATKATLEGLEKPYTPRVYKIVEHVETRQVWDIK